MREAEGHARFKKLRLAVEVAAEERGLAVKKRNAELEVRRLMIETEPKNLDQ